MMYSVTKRLEFDAGHRVLGHLGKCKTPHGHRYVAEVTCSAEVLDDMGAVIDFGVIKSLVGAWIDENWDHTMIYEADDSLMFNFASLCGAGLRPFYSMPYPPTAENMARELFYVAQTMLTSKNVDVDNVRIWETPTCCAQFPTVKRRRTD